MSITKSIHIGQKIVRIRELKGMKQETLATLLNLSQQAVSKIEQSENIEDEKIELIANALGVTVEGLRSFNEEAIIQNINNTFHDNAIQNQFNPVEKIVELYERLLKEKDDQIEMYKKQLKAS